MNIEVHHIDPEGQDGTDDVDNALPLFFECHSFVQHYNDLHPRGSKYKPEELRARRDQVYEEFTRHLVPPIHYEITQALGDGRRRTYPDVGFLVQNLGNALTVRLKVNIEVIGDDQSLGSPTGPHYSGTCLWNLNPQSLVQGHFDIPRTAKTPSKIEVVVKMTIVDMYQREHHNLPVAWVYMREHNDWYFEPSPSI